MTLRVTLEIIPFGNEENSYVIDTFNISNVGKAEGRDEFKYIIERNEYKEFSNTSEMLNHDRKKGAVALAARALHKFEKDLQ